ncbi:MAG: cystathionine beta-synthase [Actinomycetota bacterium]|nr:cystathionine beta-synthase [Actinomycetota bacterium]MEC9394742.1 cystathionine beta-synthase [Actinomycetota bacterium]MEC9467408.1 cystathionine beta-synthase [Actinomycetota bacterium]MED6328409.1 cystathionine beta-synthase [Actinomycetota bacterium]MEE2958213.1 cystathionine beta-synthase [Actinomycetota bacterium]
MDLSDLDVADDVLGLVGGTPLVRLSRLGADLPCPVLVKLETTNPGGSIKDRAAIAMIDAAEREGLLKPGGTIVEPTSGNTGVGLAIVAAQRGYRCVFVMTDKVSEEKISLLRAYGSEVVVCPVAVPPDDPQSYYSTAERLMNETPGAFRPNQYHNPANPQAHYETTGPEIWEQTKGRITHFVAGAGTGGTISGVGRYLKEQDPDVTIVVADPEGSVYSGGSGRPYLVEGVGEDFWPDTYHPDVIDKTVAVSDADSFAMAHQVTREEGLLIGGSGGTAIAAALQVAEGLAPDNLVVVVVPDSGRGYLTKVFDESWMATMGFSRADGPVIADLLNAQDDDLPELIYVGPNDTVRDAALLMRKYGVSQIAVAKGEMPLSAAEVMGSVSELWLMSQTHRSDEVLDRPIEEVVQDPLPTIGAGEPIDRAVALLEHAPALLVLDGGRPRTIVSRTDLLGFLSPDADGGV